ncbi:DUF2399 domain-containing protein [Kurthia gibsonii]|uniref:DUF2399 domain-containing protein n=1 Tax=Kurthia gibsonii TaxID=33946 RepID=UPI002DBB0113|nr:DUF2399 domain-containing protein [Kurthia gibsonii]MEB7772433.1 DUF2399 domain-containing protein [Kurthia gibsonii]
MQRAFLEATFLKKGETIERVEEIDGLFVFHIIKHTARRYLRVAQFKIAKKIVGQLEIPKEIRALKFTPKAKRNLDVFNIENIYEWLQAGWIVQETRYNADGMTVASVDYRMGPAYEQALQYKQQQTLEVEQEHIKQLEAKSKQLNLPIIFKQAMVDEQLPLNWSFSKRLRYKEFCLALYALYEKKGLYDFKEIGASLYDRIGGSKYFDVHREEFLGQLAFSGIDVSLYGLVSTGKIVSIHFTGDVEHPYAKYTIGAVHATTDNAVYVAPFSTTNTTLWLVENRAILTRMAVEVEFLKQTNSCVVCLDGQIRSAHRAFIEQLEQTKIKQTIIWTDTDVAGITIAKHAAEIIDGPVKWIGRDFEVYDVFQLFEQAHVGRAHEQEQQLGGVEQWMKWI